MSPAIRSFVVASVLALATGAACAQAIRFAPEQLDVGEWPAGKPVDAYVWIINTHRTETTRVEPAADRDPGISLVDFRATALPPSGAIEAHVRVVAPETIGETVTRTIRFRIGGERVRELPVRIEAIHPDVHLPDPSVNDSRHLPVRAAPPRIDLGQAAPGEKRDGMLWLINTTDAPVRITDAKQSCSCLDLGDVGSMSLQPHRATRIDLSMLAQNDVGQTQTKYATFIIEDRDPLPVPVSLRIMDPLESRLRRFLQAQERHDGRAMRALLTLDSRTWLERREGPGLGRDAEGFGPLDAWNRVLHATASYGELELADRTLSVRATVTSDLHRLLDVPPGELRYTFWFDDDRLVSGTLIEGLEPDASKRGRLAEFARWARVHRPRKLGFVYPGGEIIPTRERAQRWIPLLAEWRAATGQPPITIEEQSP